MKRKREKERKKKKESVNLCTRHWEVLESSQTAPPCFNMHTQTSPPSPLHQLRTLSSGGEKAFKTRLHIKENI